MHLLDVFFPKFCIGCGKLGSYLCFSCFTKLSRHTSWDGRAHRLDRLISFYRYTGVVQKIIKSIKYRFAYAVVADVVQYIDLPRFPKQSVFVPIPLHPSRLRTRGFNQAEVFAKALSLRTGIPVDSTILRRIRKTIPQVETKNRQERLINMNNVFIVPNPSAIPKVVILVDDVYTTGATMQSACAALKRAGAKTVWGVTIAQ